jgi:hypothetical protein
MTNIEKELVNALKTLLSHVKIDTNQKGLGSAVIGAETAIAKAESKENTLDNIQRQEMVKMLQRIEWQIVNVACDSPKSFRQAMIDGLPHIRSLIKLENGSVSNNYEIEKFNKRTISFDTQNN